MSKIYIIHENQQWFDPLAKVFTEAKLPYESLFLDAGSVDLRAVPPEGIYFSKMSASAYTRNHRHSPDFAAVLFAWLEAHGRRVINGLNVLRLEMSKMDQYIRLQEAGIAVPFAVACFSKQDILKQAASMKAPYILKPNRGGKGIGVQLFRNEQQLIDFVNGPDFAAAASVDEVMLLQEYIEAPEPMITRMEFVGSKFVYAVRVDTSQGFELCPAEACRIDAPAKAAEFCAIDADEGLFRILPGFTDPIVSQLEAFLAAQQIEVAGVEFIRDKQGKAYVYDINTNTNYNPEAEQKAGISAIPKLTEFLRTELEKSRAGAGVKAKRAG